MGAALKRVLFSETYRTSPHVQTFDCGSEPWHVEISQWLKAPDGAILAPVHPTHRSDVWLYLTQEDDLVGFGSLGGTIWPMPQPYNGPVPVNIIPYMGIARSFWGCPKGAPQEDRYSTLIMEDLINEAEDACVSFKREPFLTLFVHPSNAQAKKFYVRMGFKRSSRKQGIYEGMRREL